MMKTISDMYAHTKAVESKLLGSFNADFWADYETDYKKYDRLFYRLYKSFLYFLQEEEDSLEEVIANFREDVITHLLVNQKKYSEMYRINVISDAGYSLTNNYDMTETLHKSTTADKGSRTDNTTGSVGSQTVTSNAEVSPYDSENFYNDRQNTQTAGGRQDSGSFTSGAQHDAGSEDYTLTRAGNIGTMTATDMLDKHKRFWTMFDFYSYIFGEIAAELLLI